MNSARYTINLTLRFFLEITALAAAGYKGYLISKTELKFVLMILLPVIIAIIWSIFKVDNEPPLNKKAIIPVRGFIRLIIEYMIFLFAVWSAASFNNYIAFGYLILIVVYYIFSCERVKWLINN